MDNTNRIQFDTPDLTALSHHFTVVDLHFHSRYSDGADTVADIARQAQKLGIGIAITDHNSIDGAVELDRYTDVFSIPGIEITSLEGSHVLAYFHRVEDLKSFYEIHIKPNLGPTVMSSVNLDVASIIIAAKQHGGLVIFAHPYSAAFTGICNHSFTDAQLDRLLRMADGVEVINSENLKRWNLKCALLGFNLNRAVTGGSDGHSVQQMGATVVYAACPKNRKAFLDAIKYKQVKVVGTESRLLEKIQSNSVKLKTSLGNCPDLVEKNIRYGKSVIRYRTRKATEKIWQRIDNRHFKKAVYLITSVTFLKINYDLLPLLIFAMAS